MRKKHEYKWEPNSIRDILKTVSVDKTMVDLRIPHYEDICQAMINHGLIETNQHGMVMKTPDGSALVVWGLRPKGEELWDAIQDEESWHKVRGLLAGFPSDDREDKATKAAHVISQILAKS